MKELIKRGNKLSCKYNESELKAALKNAFAIGDNEERLVLQWALKKKTKTSDGYAFIKKQRADINKKLVV